MPVLRNHTLSPKLNTSLVTLLLDPGRLDALVPGKEKGPTVQLTRPRTGSKELHYIPIDALRQLTVFGLSKRDVDAYNHNEFQWGRLRSSGRDTIDTVVTFHTSIVAQHELRVVAKLRYRAFFFVLRRQFTTLRSVSPRSLSTRKSAFR